MTVQNKINAAHKLAAVIKKWPDDTHKVYTSFRQAQLKLYESDVPSQLPDAKTLELRGSAANNLLQNTNFDLFRPNTRLYRPDGNPMYYELIMREANRKQAKWSFFTALRNTAFGWWKK